MLDVTADTIRVFLHVLAATVWVGGQLTLAGLVPGLRDLAADAPGAVARRFNRIAWPAYGVLVATGIWNITDVDPAWDSAHGRTVIVKIGVVAASGVSALLHAVCSFAGRGRCRIRAAVASSTNPLTRAEASGASGIYTRLDAGYR